MEISENTIVLIAVIIAVVIIICVLVYVRYNPVCESKKYKWVKTCNNAYDTHGDMTVFGLSSNITVDHNKGINIKIPKYTEYYELCIYTSKDLTLVRTIPYPHHLQLGCPKAIAPGKYTLILRCKGKGMEEWTTEPSVETMNIETSHISQTAMGINYDDAVVYNTMGEYFNTIADGRDDTLISSKISTTVPLYPLSLYIHREHLDIDIEPNHNIVIIVPNRIKTMGLPDTVMIDGDIIDSNIHETFNAYEVSGKDRRKVSIDQYIYGNINEERLPFYVYTFADT